MDSRIVETEKDPERAAIDSNVRLYMSIIHSEYVNKVKFSGLITKGKERGCITYGEINAILRKKVADRADPKLDELFNNILQYIGCKDIRIAEKLDDSVLACSTRARKPVNPERAYYEEIHAFPMMSSKKQIEKSKQIRLFKRQLITFLSRPEFSGLLYNVLNTFYVRNKKRIDSEKDEEKENPIYKIRYWQEGFHRPDMVRECLNTIDRIDSRIDGLYALYLDNQDALSVDARQQIAARIRFKENNKQRILLSFSYKHNTLARIMVELVKRRDKHNRWRIAFIKKIYDQYKSAMDDMVNANYRLVVGMANWFRVNYHSELIQEGNLGLMDAVDVFDYSRGYKFSTPATWWIRQKMQLFKKRHRSMIRIPVNYFEIDSRIKKARREHFIKTGVMPDDETISSLVGRSVQDIRRISRTMNVPLSIDRAVTNEDDASSMRAFIQDYSSEDPAAETQKMLLAEQLEKVLGALTGREKEIIRLRYGFDGQGTHSLKEIGIKFNVSRERVRQIQAKAIRKLQYPARSRGLEAFLDNVARDNSVYPRPRCDS